MKLIYFLGACFLLMNLRAETSLQKIETGNRHFEITILRGWEILKSRSLKVKLLVKKSTNESFVLTEFSNVGALDVTKEDIDKSIRNILRNGQKILKKEVLTNANGVNFKVFSISDGSEDKTITYIIFFSDATSINRGVCVLKNDEIVKARIEKILGSIKKK